MIVGMSTNVSIRVLGGFDVTVDDRPTASRGWARRGAAALVKVLALAPGHHLHREQVMDLLWPDESPEKAAPKLHKAAHFARQVTGRHDAVVLRDDVVRLFPGAVVTVDALRFEQLARAAVASGDPTQAHEALTWYRGELLPADRYDEWAADRRVQLHLRHLDVLRVAGDWPQLVELDPDDHHVRPRVATLLRELADLSHRQQALLEELAEAGIGPVALLGAAA
jgi:DNA-binding SARP family transcriptional activator